jgi:hypothetical protein
VRYLNHVAAWTALLYFAWPAPAWNSTGHRIIAAIAYDRLTPQTRARVDALLKAHPDYARFTRNAPSDPPTRARAAFLAASLWADDIKGDPRFWDDTRNDAAPTPVLSGFPDMKRHTNWHYYDTPYAPDHARVQKAKPPTALSELPRLIRELASAPEAMVIYDLPWVEHIVGDLHQPLHCVSRFLKSEPKSDAGGNNVILARHRNLHALWDESAGNDPSDAYVNQYVTEATSEYPAPDPIEKSPKKWIQEGFAVARSDVYTFGNETGSREHPLQLPDAYFENARHVARIRIVLAGYRLAEVLNQRLK